MSNKTDADGLSRRQYLSAVGISSVATVGLAGCVDSIPFLGDEPLEFSASPASISEAVLESEHFEHEGTEAIELSETVEAAGQSQEVIATNYLANYVRTVDLDQFPILGEESADAVTVGVFSTPQISVLGRSFNPIDTMDNEELAALLEEQLDDMGPLELVDEHAVTILGEAHPVREYDTEATLEDTGMTVDASVYLSDPIESGDDFVLAVGGYPTVLDERESVFSLFEAIDHE